MFISTTILKNSIDSYHKNKKEYYHYSEDDNSEDNLEDNKIIIFKLVFNLIILVIAIIFFIMELLVLIYAVNIAINCSSVGKNRIVHLVLAVMFTSPYMLLNIFFGKDCPQNFLKSESLL